MNCSTHVLKNAPKGAMSLQDKFSMTLSLYHIPLPQKRRGNQRTSIPIRCLYHVRQLQEFAGADPENHFGFGWLAAVASF